MVIPALPLVVLMLAPLVFAALAAFDRALLWPTLAADLSIAVVAVVDLLLALRPRVSVRRSCREVFSIGRVNPVTIELRSLARRTLAVQLRDDLFAHASSPDLPIHMSLKPGERQAAQYRVIPTRRGGYALGDHHLRYRSPFGLWTRQLRVPAAQPVRVYPDVQSVRDYELLARQNREHAMVRASRRRGGESEFEALREYQRDDEYRRIDWKATARRHKVMARQYQLERDQSVVFMLDAGRLMRAEAGELSLFDHALNAALMLAYVASRGGDQVGLLLFADRVRTYLPPAPGKGAAQRLMRALFAVHPELCESDFEEAFSQLGPRLRKRGLVVVFTQVIDEKSARTLLRLTRGLQPRHLPLVVLLRDTAVEALALPGAEAAAPELYAAAAAAELLAWRDQLIRDLRRGGALVLDVAPRELSPSLVNRYLEVKARHLL